MRDYEKIIRDLIDIGHEGVKVDFKSLVDFKSKLEIAELAKLVLAIANADSDELDDIGYVIVGAERKNLIGGIDAFREDSLCAAIPRKLNNYLAPEAFVEVKPFLDPAVGWFGAIIVKPSFRTMRPHFVAKEFSAGKVVFRKNEVYVRHGESIELATRDDFDRMYSQRFAPDLDQRSEPKGHYPDPTLLFLYGGKRCSEFELPPLVTRLPDEPQIPLPFSQDEIDGADPDLRPGAIAYNEELAKYRARLLEFTTNKAERDAVKESLICLRLALRNDGETPIEGAVFSVSVPEPLILQNPHWLPNSIPEPALPTRPRLQHPPPRPSQRVPLNDPYLASGLAALASTHAMIGQTSVQMPAFNAMRDILSMSPPVEKWGKVSVDVNHRRLNGHLNRLRHGSTVDFDEVFALIPGEAQDIYELSYVIQADNLPRAKKGVLRVKVRQGAPPPPSPWGERKRG